MGLLIPPNGKTSYEHIFGLFLLLLVVAIWVSSNFIIKGVFGEYNKPFLVTYINNSFFMINLLVRGVTEVWRQYGPKWKWKPFFYTNDKEKEEEDGSSSIRSDKGTDRSLTHVIEAHEASMRHRTTDQHVDTLHPSEESTLGFLPADSTAELLTQTNDTLPDKSIHSLTAQQKSEEVEEGKKEEGDEDIERRSVTPSARPPSYRHMLLYAVIFSLLYFSACYANNLALAYTSVSTSTILATTSGFFTLFIGAAFGIERISIMKTLAIGISLGGVVLVLIDSGDEEVADEKEYHYKPLTPAPPLVGNILALLGALLYGCYTIYLKKHLKSDSHDVVTLFFGYVGIVTPLLLLPFALIVHFTGFEPQEIIRSKEIYLSIIANALIGTVLSQYLWARAMLLTTPLMCTLGLSLTIPLTVISELWFKGLHLRWRVIVGGALVLIGFIIVNIGMQKDHIERAVDHFFLDRFRRVTRTRQNQKEETHEDAGNIIHLQEEIKL